jgi:hypothetical protein
MVTGGGTNLEMCQFENLEMEFQETVLANYVVYLLST